MASTYRFRKDAGPFEGKVNSAGTVEVGDMLKWVAGNSRFEQMSATKTDGRLLAGVSEGQVPIASNIDNVTGLEDKVRIKPNGIFLFKTTATETYVHGTPLYIGADPQTVSTAVGAGDAALDIVGYAWLPDGSSVTGAAGTDVEVRLRANYPSSYLAS